MADKIRIRKSIRPKVELWSGSLEVSESEFVHEALTHYIRFLEGKPTGSNVINLPLQLQNADIVNTSEESESAIVKDESDGGFAL